MVFTVSRPCLSGGEKPNSRPSASRNAGLIFSQIPTVRSPCTLLWPRTGQRPAPRRPICPRRSAKLTMLCTLATPFSCWVIPIAQLQIIRSEPSAILAASAMSSRETPLSRTIASHDAASRSRTSASNPSVWCAMKSCARSLPPAARSASSISFMIPFKSATSPLTRTGRNSEAISVPRPSSESGSCGFLNRIIPVSGSGLTLTILQPLRGGLLQLRQHARVAGAGVLADDEDAVGVAEVLDLHRRLADADRLGQPEAARFVAHVRAVGEVVGPELADEEAVEKSRFVAGAPRGVKRRLVGRGERVELLGDQRERLVPRDRLVVVGPGAAHHRVRQAPLLVEPHVALRQQLGDRMLREELGRDARARRLGGHRLGAVLAELGRLSLVVGIRPGAARAVEAVLLVEVQAAS